MGSGARHAGREVIRVLVVDDHPLLRAGLAAQMEQEPDLELCGEAEDETGALAAVADLDPDVAVVDIALKAGHGIDLIRAIRKRFPEVRMLALSAFPESVYGERALRAGALGYLHKQGSVGAFVDAVRTVAAGRRHLSPELAERIVGQAVSGAAPAAGSPLDALTDRELEVFRLIGEGLSTGHIARRLVLSTHTIDTHRGNIKRKLGLRSGGELQQRAIQWVLEEAS